MKNDKTREVGMFKLIWKNLWARRRKNGWLLAELILVSIISWVVLDPVIVVTHDRNIPLGYDAERLCLISLGALQPQDARDFLAVFREALAHFGVRTPMYYRA